MSAIKLLSSKTSPNAIRLKKKIVERVELVSALDKARQYPLTLIVAPAGHGKTTLATAWFKSQQRKGRHIAWYALDKTDDRVAQFAHYFTGLLSQVTGLSLPAYDEESELSDYFHQILISLNEVQSPFFLVIDDFQFITCDLILDGLKFWLKHQPHAMHLVLISRSIPPLQLTRRRIEGEILVIDSKQLAFTNEHAYLFFELANTQCFVTQKNNIEILNQQVEGWVIALRLFSMAAEHNHAVFDSPKQFLSQLTQYDTDNYLRDEVFCHLDDVTNEFMERCAVLRVVNEQLAIALTQDKNSLKKLYELEEQGLFVHRCKSNDSDLWWKFSPIFSIYLALQCRLKLPTEWQFLHKTAATKFLEIGEYSEALYHAQHLDDIDLLYEILNHYGWLLFHHGEVKSLENGLNKLPQALICKNESLLLLKAWLAQAQHRHYEVSEILEKFNPTPPFSGILHGRFTALNAQVAINAGNAELAYKLAKEAIVNMPTSANYERIVAMSVIGEAQHCRGDLKSALATMQQVEKIAISKHAYHNWLWAKLQQTEILSAQGYWQAAYDMLKGTNLPTMPLKQIVMHEFLYLLKGQVLWEWHQLDEAEIMAHTGIELVKDNEQVQCLTLLAKISLTKGDLDNAERLIDECQQILTLFPAHHDWFTALDEVKLIYWQLKEDVAPLESWLVQVTFPTTDNNHFVQKRWRNIVRCYLLQKRFDEALDILNRLITTATEHGLISDLQRALILRNRTYFLSNEKQLAQVDLIHALELSRQTNFISAFVVEGDLIAKQIRKCLESEKIDELTTHKAKYILTNINQHNQHKFAHFDEQFVAKLLANPEVPELLRISPLTSREWQVLGLIYSGYSNDQISQELFVAITTVKTHVRNLYQKFGVSNRREAIEYTKTLLEVMGYSK